MTSKISSSKCGSCKEVFQSPTEPSQNPFNIFPIFLRAFNYVSFFPNKFYRAFPQTHDTHQLQSTMPIPCGLESLLCLGFTRWAYKRCSHAGAHDSATWPTATAESSISSSFEPIPRLARAILAVYEPDLSRPKWAPQPHGYQMDPTSILKRATHSETRDRSPPYLVYLDREAKELILAFRGLDLVRNGDYRMLLDNAHQMFDGGYVHRGLMKAAVWVLNREAGLIGKVMGEVDKEWKVVFCGHSLGAGVAALMAAVAVNYLDEFGGIERERVKGYALAPPRCMSLSLAVKYADVVSSVILQDDFLPRTSTSLEHLFGSIFCLPCLLVLVCMRDTFISEDKKLKDPTRLYAPGRIYHIVERNPCSCGTIPPEVRTAIPVEGRFEHIVLSCNAINDHRIVWIEREAQKALDRMKEIEIETTPPIEQKMERELSLKAEHKDATERVLLLDVARASSLEESSEETSSSPLYNTSSCSDSITQSRSEWVELVEELLDEEESDDSLAVG